MDERMDGWRNDWTWFLYIFMCSMISKENTHKALKTKAFSNMNFSLAANLSRFYVWKKTHTSKRIWTLPTKESQTWKLLLHTFQLIIYLDLPKGAKWFLRVSIHHPLGFDWHPLEGAGTSLMGLWFSTYTVKLFRTPSLENSLFFGSLSTSSPHPKRPKGPYEETCQKSPFWSTRHRGKAHFTWCILRVCCFSHVFWH